MERTSPITELKNVGEQRAKKLNRMGIETIGDLLEHYPRDYKDRSRLTKIADLSETDENTFLARVKGEGQTGRRGRLTFTRLQVFDDTDEITLLWYNQPYMKTALKSGEVYLFTGRMQKKYNRREIVSPEYESIKDKLACKTDLDAHFTEKVIGNREVDVLDIGAVHFPSGTIFACDPLVELEDTPPFIQTIPAGTYPVKICVVPSEKYGDRYACVKVEVSREMLCDWSTVWQQ